MCQRGIAIYFQVVVTYPNKQVARNVPMLISANGTQGDVQIELNRFDRDPNVRGFTDEFGEAEFVIDACSNCQAITIQVHEISFERFNVFATGRRGGGGNFGIAALKPCF